jgi:hypothetical protein
MAEETPQTEISPDDIQNVADKLQGFMAELPEQEQNVLGWILTRAQAAGELDDTAGHSYGLVYAPSAFGAYRTPIAAQLVRSAGLGAAAGTTKIGWEYSTKGIDFRGFNINPTLG